MPALNIVIGFAFALSMLGLWFLWVSKLNSGWRTVFIFKTVVVLAYWLIVSFAR